MRCSLLRYAPQQSTAHCSHLLVVVVPQQSMPHCPRLLLLLVVTPQQSTASAPEQVRRVVRLALAAGRSTDDGADSIAEQDSRPKMARAGASSAANRPTGRTQSGAGASGRTSKGEEPRAHRGINRAGPGGAHHGGLRGSRTGAGRSEEGGNKRDRE